MNTAAVVGGDHDGGGGGGGGEETLVIHLDRARIATTGLRIIDKYLLPLHVYRCVAETAAGNALYEDMTEVDARFAEYRALVVKHKEPGKQIILPNTVIDHVSGDVVLREYEATQQGMYQSWAERNL